MSEVRDQDSALGFTDPIASLRAALKGRYEIERQVGQGAFATVYLARDLKHERKVAIKVLNADPESETGEIRFIREIRVVARLQHPNILPLHDSGHVEALLYYVMPYVMGETLRIRMHRERQMGVEAACAIARETADALAYAHSQGIVHRDIKPENILLSGGHAIVADFGIARAIDIGGVKQLTMTGVAGPGTPAYMSPEQLLGDRAVDARSDIYSLGCVLYEMLAGKPPFPGKDGFVKRFTEPPPHISSLRRDAPPWVDDVVARALAKDPDDRFRTAGDFVTALSKPVTPVRPPNRETFLRNALASPPLFESDPLEAQELSAAFPRSYPSPGLGAAAGSGSGAGRGTSRRWIEAVRGHPVAAAISVVVVAAITALAATGKISALPTMLGARAQVDSSRYVVLSSGYSAVGSSNVGSQVADSIYDALAKWEGLTVVPNTRVDQAVADGADPPNTEQAALALARHLRAGTAVWIQASGPPQTQRLRIHRYDVGSGETRDEFGLPAEARDQRFYANAARRLIGLRDRPPEASGCDDRTRFVRAWSACNNGHSALVRWDIPAAENAFRQALAADRDYAPARLWLAQSMAWRTPERRSEIYDLVRAATESRDLSPRDRLAAAALTAFLEQRFADACVAYTGMTRLDSRDFVGWYGLGDCQTFDSLVVRNGGSPSGWAFRTSWHSAANAYVTALRFQPGAHEIAASRLQILLQVSPTLARPGVGAGPDRPRFRAYPTLEQGDTVGFIPYPAKEFEMVERGPSAEAALRKNTTRLFAVTAAWADRFPRSSRAQESLADALEAQAELGEGPPQASAALRAIDSAVSLIATGGEPATRSADIARLRARKVRVHFKRGEFGLARTVADSLLRSAAPPGMEREFQWVAALVGRANLAADYWQRSLRTSVVTGGAVHPAISRPASKYFVYASLGICGPLLSDVRQQLEVALRDYITSDIRNALRSDLADRSAVLATPCTAGKIAPAVVSSADHMISAQRSFARGDMASARRSLAAFAAERRDRRPGDTSAEYVFQAAWLRVQLGDTAGAAESLDGALGALPTFGAATFRDLAGAAAFGRLMKLRAEIAARTNDPRVSRVWTTALGELWASADPILRDQVNELVRTSPAGLPGKP